MKIEIKKTEIANLLSIEHTDFERYISPLLNLSNQYAQGTRPKVVGQLSELIKEFDGETLGDWEDFYTKKYPDAIDKATKLIFKKVEEIKQVISTIDYNTTERWVRDLVFSKTFLGLKIQKAILIKVAQYYNCEYKVATNEEEAKGIDGYIGLQAVSIKPSTYEEKTKSLPEEIGVEIIKYRKTKNGCEIEFNELLTT